MKVVDINCLNNDFFLRKGVEMTSLMGVGKAAYEEGHDLIDIYNSQKVLKLIFLFTKM